MLPARVSSVTFGVSMCAASRLTAAAATGPTGIFEVRPATRADRVVRRACRRHHQARRPEVLEVAGASRAVAGPGQVRVDVARRRGELRRHAGPRRALRRRAQAAVRRRLRGRGHDRRGRRRRRRRARRRARHGRHAASAATPRRSSCPPPTSVALPERLSFEEGAAVPVDYATAWAALLRLRLAARGRARARPRGRRRCRHRRAAAGQARRAPRSTARPRPASTPAARARPRPRVSTTAATAGGATCRSYDLIIDGIGGASFKRSYALLRPGGRLVALGASSVQEGETRNLRRALPQALRMMRGFDLIKQMSESKAVIGINMKRAVGRPRHAGALDRAADRAASTTAPSRRSSTRRSRSTAPARPIGSSPRGRTWGRSCCVP